MKAKKSDPQGLVKYPKGSIASQRMKAKAKAAKRAEKAAKAKSITGQPLRGMLMF